MKRGTFLIEELIPVEQSLLLPPHPVVLFSPRHAMYDIVHEMCQGLSSRQSLIAAHREKDHPQLPETWRDTLTTTVDTKTLIIVLCWYRDQFAEGGVSCQCFLFGEQSHRFIERVSGKLKDRGICQQSAVYDTAA